MVIRSTIEDGEGDGDGDGAALPTGAEVAFLVGAEDGFLTVVAGAFLSVLVVGREEMVMEEDFFSRRSLAMRSMMDLEVAPVFGGGWGGS